MSDWALFEWDENGKAIPQAPERVMPEIDWPPRIEADTLPGYAVADVRVTQAGFQPLPPRADLRWAAIDLDGTLAEGIWAPDNPTSDIGPVKVYPSGKTARDLCLELVAAGYKIVVHTARGYTDLENIERWLEFNEIPYRQVVCGKLLARVYIDDRNLDIFNESWVPEEGDPDG